MTSGRLSFDLSRNEEIEPHNSKVPKNKRNRSESLFVGTTEQSSIGNFQNEKRRFSLDFIFRRKSSKGKLIIADDEKTEIASSTISEVSSHPKPTEFNETRRQSSTSSTRMEGNSQLAAWCFI